MRRWGSMVLRDTYLYKMKYVLFAQKNPRSDYRGQEAGYADSN